MSLCTYILQITPTDETLAGVLAGDSANFLMEVEVLPGWSEFNVVMTGDGGDGKKVFH